MNSATLHAKYLNEAMEDFPDRTLRTAWRSPANIALVKYWGKHPGQIPQNASLSFTLSHSVTDMHLNLKRNRSNKDGLQLEFLFEGKPREDFAGKISTYLESVSDYFPFLKGAGISIRSSNTFPHSSGIASSASSFSALALCLCTLETDLRGMKPGTPAFLQKASYMARLGSGSAARSVYGPFVSWGRIQSMEGTSDLFASRVQQPVDEVYHELHDAVLIVSSQKKKTSSSAGHGLMVQHPYRKDRYRQAEENLRGLFRALGEGQVEAFIRICESEALSLHALMLSSDPGFLLLEPGTLEIIRRIRSYRRESGRFLTFTIDAGPNVHLIYPATERKAILEFIHAELLDYCEEGNWLDDHMGGGPAPLPI